MTSENQIFNIRVENRPHQDSLPKKHEKMGMELVFEGDRNWDGMICAHGTARNTLSFRLIERVSGVADFMSK